MHIRKPDNQHDFSKKIQKIPIDEFYNDLKAFPLSVNMKNFLLSFDTPRPINTKNFLKGVKKITALANLNPLNETQNGRREFYGSIYLGLHYANDLVQLWNANPKNKHIKKSDLSVIVPSDWDSVELNGFQTLIYNGQHPAQALDELVKGPSIIDCSMFTQLSLWFGIRYMLGNERFNQCFGRAPFFITDIVYQDIENSNEPYSGNPLFSFLSTKEQVVIPVATIKHISNTQLYPFKHPGGGYGGQNSILIGDQYYIFDPHLANTQGLTESEILKSLHNAFNAERAQCSIETLALYAESLQHFHPVLSKSYGKLVEIAEILKDKKLTEEEFFNEKHPLLELTFDFHKFLAWMQLIENRVTVEYLPRSIDYSLMPVELLKAIPFENKMSMDFSTFKQETFQQKEFITISQQFCASVMADESKLVVLIGKAGIGKTASAVCAAKELAARGKKIIWISAVVFETLAEQAKNFADLDKCNLEIEKILATNPDAIFLDDDNTTTFSGKLLLEKTHNWYMQHSGKGLFITSNEPIRFKCGATSSNTYHYPRFIPYHASQYLNRQYKTDLVGESLRSKQDEQSIGTIVDESYWEIHKIGLEPIELIPAFDPVEELAPIRVSLKNTGCTGNTYKQLRPIQQKWLHVSSQGTRCLCFEKKFERTAYKTIALEIGEFTLSSAKKMIIPNCIDQLIRVVEYAHDQAGKRVILINKTSFNRTQLMLEIKMQIPESKREKIWSRLTLLLCETPNSISKYAKSTENINPERNPIGMQSTYADKYTISPELPNARKSKTATEDKSSSVVLSAPPVVAANDIITSGHYAAGITTFNKPKHIVKPVDTPLKEDANFWCIIL